MSQCAAEFSVLFFSDRRQLAQFLGHLDMCLTKARGHRYAERSPDLELWACTDVVTADTLAVRGPCLYANDAVMGCVANAGLPWTYAGRISRTELTKDAWPVLSALASVAPSVERSFSDHGSRNHDAGNSAMGP